MLSLIWRLDSGPQDCEQWAHVGALRPDQFVETEPQTAPARVVLVLARPEASLVSQLRGHLQDPWPYREPLLSLVDLSSPHRERIRCRRVTSWRNCLINARPGSDVAMLPLSCNDT